MVLSPNAPHLFRLPRLQFDRSLAIAFAIGLHLAFGLWMAMPVSVAPDLEAPPPLVQQPAKKTIVDIVPAKVTEPMPPVPTLTTPARRVEAPPTATPQPTPIVIDTPTAWAEPAPEVIPTNDFVGETNVVAAPTDSAVPLAYGSASPPAYPRAEARLGHEGTVLLKVLVDETGAIIEVGLHQGSGYRGLDQAAMRHVKREWQFRPAVVDGRAVKAWAIVPIEFRLL